MVKLNKKLHLQRERIRMGWNNLENKIQQEIKTQKNLSNVDEFLEIFEIELLANDLDENITNKIIGKLKRRLIEI